MSFVNMNAPPVAGRANQELFTQGLQTCIGVVAHGSVANANSINKVMVHASTPRVLVQQGNLISAFVQRVQASGFRVHAVCLSVPDPTWYNTVPDAELIQQIRAINPNARVDAQALQNHRLAMKQMLANANNSAKQILLALGASLITLQRKNQDAYSGAPFGEMRALPNGGRHKVTAEGKTMDVI